MLGVAEIVFALFLTCLILFVICCLYMIAEHECQEWRRHRKGKK